MNILKFTLIFCMMISLLFACGEESDKKESVDGGGASSDVDAGKTDSGEDTKTDGGTQDDAGTEDAGETDEITDAGETDAVTDAGTDSSVDPNVVGEVTVDLDANKVNVPTKESLLGNLASDAAKEYADAKIEKVDFAVTAGGNLRFDPNTRPDGIYKAGEITKDILQKIYKYKNTAVVVEVTGVQLKEIFEHSVAGLPHTGVGDPAGAFLQVSKGVEILIDLDKIGEKLDENNTEIVTPGERIVSIKLDGKEIKADTTTYKILTDNYRAGGGDKFVTLKKLDAAKKKDSTVDLIVTMEEYFQKNTPVTPKLEGRIKFVTP